MEIKFNDDKLKKLQRNLKKIQGQKQVSLPELLPDDFIQQYTDFQTLQAMADACGIEAMEKQTAEFAKFISTHTRFGTWREMLEAAKAAYIKRKLGL
jgi:hypothetical protein